MCSILSKKNRNVGISKTGCVDEQSETSGSVTYAKSSDTSSCNCSHNIEENAESQTITEQGNDQVSVKYLDQSLFTLLIPALEETLIEASKWNALRVQKCRFNGLDYIAEILWNRNPRRSKLFSPRLNVFNIPTFKEYLQRHPRPYYPKSWLWSEDEAVLHIQRHIRGWLVRKRADVQEMRTFWKEVAVNNNANKNVPCTVQLQRILRKVQNNREHEITDEQLVSCEKYHLMQYAHGTTISKERNNIL